jgi:hypothetical protein
MSWYWFSFLTEPPTDALAMAAAYTPDGRLAGYLSAWEADRRRPLHALSIDRRAVDPDGEEAWVSLALTARGVRILYDDPAVCGAMRAVLAGPRVVAMSTLARDSSAIGGAITAVRGTTVASLGDDPFARIFPARVLRVDRGFVGEMPAPTGPGIQRYSGAPWPWDVFARDVASMGMDLAAAT